MPDKNILNMMKQRGQFLFVVISQDLFGRWKGGKAQQCTDSYSMIPMQLL